MKLLTLTVGNTKDENSTTLTLKLPHGVVEQLDTHHLIVDDVSMHFDKPVKVVKLRDIDEPAKY